MAEPAPEAPAPSIEERIAATIAPEEPPPKREPEHEEPEARQEPEPPEESPEETPEESPEENAPIAAEAGDDDVIEIGDITQLAEHLGVDAAEVYNIAIPYTKDGERHEFTLGEIKDMLPNFQESVAAREQAESTYAKYQQAEAKMAEAMQVQAYQVGEVLKQAEQALLADMQAINWQELERSNPGEWARQSESFRRKQGQLRQIGANVAQSLEKQQQQYKAQVASMQQESLAREQHRLLKAIPEWRKDEVADTERRQITEYMTKSGFTTEELGNVTDHRAIVLARKAMLFDKLQAGGDVARKKVVKLATKVTKPGQRRTAKEQQHGREAAAVAAHRANPKSIDSAAERIRLRLGRK